MSHTKSIYEIKKKLMQKVQKTKLKIHKKIQISN